MRLFFTFLKSVMLLMILSCVLYADVPPNERIALVAFYNATLGENWSNSSNWLNGDPCTNSWYGITCD